MKTGSLYILLTINALHITPRKPRTALMLEWGPGGGANAVSFSCDVRQFYGVDISTANLEECGRQLTQRGYLGFHPVPIAPDHPETCLKSVQSPVDFFLSTAVFQHFPSKSYGERVSKIACQLLADDGLALIQTRYDDGREELRAKKRDYNRNAIAFTSYKIDEFWEITVTAGFQPLAVILKPEDRYAYYYLAKGIHYGESR